MKQLAYFALEGLLQQGPHRVWITLGTYPSAELARRAAGSPCGVKPNVVQTRVMPLYRISEQPLQVVHTLNLPTADPAPVHDAITVA